MNVLIDITLPERLYFQKQSEVCRKSSTTDDVHTSPWQLEIKDDMSFEARKHNLKIHRMTDYEVTASSPVSVVEISRISVEAPVCTA